MSGGPPRPGAPIELVLREFIEEQRNSDLSGAVHRLFEAFTEHRVWVADKFARIEEAVEDTRRGHSQRIKKMENALEETGRYEVGELRANRKWWIKTVLSIVGAVAAIVFTALVATMFERMSSAKPSNTHGMGSGPLHGASSRVAAIHGTRYVPFQETLSRRVRQVAGHPWPRHAVLRGDRRGFGRGGNDVRQVVWDRAAGGADRAPAPIIV
jgi:hypothetical protein